MKPRLFDRICAIVQKLWIGASPSGDMRDRASAGAPDNEDIIARRGVMLGLPVFVSDLAPMGRVFIVYPRLDEDRCCG